MTYKDLTPKTVVDYIKLKTHIFNEDAKLEVYEIGDGENDGDGFVNHVYRVWDENKSVILKQAKPYLKAFGKAVTLTTDRNQQEAEIIRLKTAIVPEYMPKMYHVDPENHLFIYEDCGHLKIMRFELTKGKSFPKFPKQIGEFIAKSNFYTSEIYLDQVAHKALMAKFMNPEMRVIMETILFLRDSFIEKEVEISMEAPDPNHLAMSDLLWDKRELRVELLKLRGIFMKQSECLVHGDLHTSNIMIDENEMKIIDMEYPFMGPTSSDMGYLGGNIVYEYIAWYHHLEGSKESRKAYRKEILGYLREMITRYIQVYSECWDQDAKDIYREYTEYREDLLSHYIKDVCGFMGCQMISRVGSIVPLPDFDVIKDLSSRNCARRLTLLIADSLVMKREEMESVDDIIDLIEAITKRYFKVMNLLQKHDL